MAAWQPVLILVSAASLGVGYYVAYRRGGGRAPRRLLWAMTSLTVLSWLVPVLGALR